MGITYGQSSSKKTSKSLSTGRSVAPSSSYGKSATSSSSSSSSSSKKSTSRRSRSRRRSSGGGGGGSGRGSYSPPSSSQPVSKSLQTGKSEAPKISYGKSSSSSGGGGGSGRGSSSSSNYNPYAKALDKKYTKVKEGVVKTQSGQLMSMDTSGFGIPGLKISRSKGKTLGSVPSVSNVVNNIVSSKTKKSSSFKSQRGFEETKNYPDEQKMSIAPEYAQESVFSQSFFSSTKPEQQDVRKESTPWSQMGMTREQWEDYMDYLSDLQKSEQNIMRGGNIPQENVMVQYIYDEQIPTLTDISQNFSRFDLYGRWGYPGRKFKSFKRISKTSPQDKARRLTGFTFGTRTNTGFSSLKNIAQLATGKKIVTKPNPLTKVITQLQTKPLKAKSQDILKKIW